MKKLIISGLAMFISLTSVMAQEETGIGNHLGWGVGFGTEGFNASIATDLTQYAELEFGVNWAPGFARTENGDAFYLKDNGDGTFSRGKDAGNMDIKAKVNRATLDFKGSVYPFAANAISGYSGAGKKGIAEYEDKNRSYEYDAPRLYAMSMAHKHLPEMQVIAGLAEKPLFNPYVCDFLEGMLVTIPLYTNRLTKKYTVKEIHDLFEDYYKGQDFVRVMPLKDKGTEDGFLSAAHLAGKDYMEIYFAGNDDRINITCALDNLGKGASGAAIESMNIVLGLDPKTGLEM